jgi:diketogulonate reductase-like aldo/keto reductase
MERRVFGPTGREVSVIGQGTWKLRDHAAAARALARGLELGLDHIDTAELYKGSEATIAPVIAPVVSAGRSDVFLVSKVLPHHADRSGTIAACDASLARLGVDALDVYLLHWPGPHPIEETMHAMAELIDAGKIRAAGVSNFDVAEMEEARDALGGHPLACNQVRYAPDHRGIEEEVLPWCQKHNVAVVGYSSFGSGEFPGGSKARKALAAIGAQRLPHPQGRIRGPRREQRGITAATAANRRGGGVQRAVSYGQPLSGRPTVATAETAAAPAASDATTAPQAPR